jgi:hypothetical protein
MAITHREAWQYWMDNYKYPSGVKQALAFYEQEKARGFNGYCNEEECLEEIERAKVWESYEGWELQVYLTVLTTEISNCTHN